MKVFFQKIFVSQCRKSSYWNPLGCHWFRVSKYFMLQMVMSRQSVEKILSHRTEKLCMGTILCCVSESFRYRINLWMRSAGVSKFSAEIFLSHSVENCRRELFSLSLISGIEEVRMRHLGGSVKIFRRKFFSHSAQNFVG